MLMVLAGPVPMLMGTGPFPDPVVPFGFAGGSFWQWCFCDTLGPMRFRGHTAKGAEMHKYLRKLVIGALGAMAVLFSTTAFAQGTAADAKAMLDKTVAAIKADKAKTLDQINKGENGFLVKDMYPFCFSLSDGLLVAVGNPNVKGLLGKDARTFKDPTGDVYGPRLYDAAKEGQVNEVSYMSPKAGADTTWVPKVSLVTAVAGLGCGVGYYK
jgi:hypothetical protein